jgi:hypothetical protein
MLSSQGSSTVFYVGHVDKSSLYDHYNILSKHHHKVAVGLSRSLSTLYCPCHSITGDVSTYHVLAKCRNLSRTIKM